MESGICVAIGGFEEFQQKYKFMNKVHQFSRSKIICSFILIIELIESSDSIISLF